MDNNSVVKVPSYCPCCIGTGWGRNNRLCGVCEGNGSVMRSMKIAVLIDRTEQRVLAQQARQSN